MDEKTFDFWQDHSPQYLEMALRTDHRERIERPDGYGLLGRACGDTVEIFLAIHNECLLSVSYEINGCIHTNACVNTVAHLAEGRPLKEVWKIAPRDIIEYLETLPEPEFHCADLAIGAFRRALANHLELRRHPWRRLYS